MKKKLNNSIIVGRLLSVSSALIIFFLIALSGCDSKNSGQATDTYTCPMHPTVVSDKPGTCPVCGMDLVRKARPGEETEMTGELARLIKAPNEIVAASIQTIKGEYKTMPVTVTAQGLVTYDTRFVYSVPARIGGRLEQVYLKYVFQPVARGQKVAEIYSPEMITAQRELLFLLENDAENLTLIESAKKRLALLGASTTQIEDVVAHKNVIQTFSIYSHYAGYVMPGAVAAPVLQSKPAASSMMGEAAPAMAATTPAQESSGLPRIGTYVAAGQTLFQVVNTSALRIELNLPLSLANAVKVNDEVTLYLGEGETEKVKVSFVQPFLSQGEEFLKVRLFVKNDHNFKIGQLINASLTLASKEALWIPASAVLDSGMENIVFVKEGEIFKPKVVTTGVQVGDWTEVVRGLASADEIASNAQFMIDSESFVKTK